MVRHIAWNKFIEAQRLRYVRSSGCSLLRVELSLQPKG